MTKRSKWPARAEKRFAGMCVDESYIITLRQHRLCRAHNEGEVTVPQAIDSCNNRTSSISNSAARVLSASGGGVFRRNRWSVELPRCRKRTGNQDVNDTAGAWLP